ncbi:sensor histidine kinase [Azospirillum sp. sgz302134]
MGMQVGRRGDRLSAAARRLVARGTGGMIVLLALLAALSGWVAGEAVRRRALDDMRAAGYQRLDLYASMVSTALEKYSYLPSLLTRDPDIRALLAAPGDAALAERVDRNLEVVNADARSAALYVMDGHGVALAASNWREPGSFVGYHYEFRPYFMQAVARGSGRYYGVGVTTSRPGYFIAGSAHGPDGAVTGVVVVKVDLDPLQQEWARGGEGVMLTDANKVAILASRPDWRYGTLADPTPEIAAEIAATRQYADATLHRLNFVETERLPGGERIISTGKRRALMLSRPLPDLGWTLHFVSDLAPVAQRQRDTGVMAGAGILAAGLLVLALRQRRLRQRTLLEARAAVADALRAARDELERKVEERTADLRGAQEELVHAGKMAALGQMSAALAHEINQPLAAIRTFIASTRVFAERGDLATVATNLDMIDDLTGRMAEITGHLKTFARKSPGRREAVALERALDRALLLVEPSLRQDGIDLDRQPGPDAWVMGDAIRLEQVFVNLLRNAADAMKDAPQRRLTVTVADGGDLWEVRVADTGTGIAAADLDKLFDPFFSTKEVGQGLGLGLSLSYGIVQDFGGTLRAENGPGGGAVFAVSLPKAAAPSPGSETLHV